jgi:hypothetical protein
MNILECLVVTLPKSSFATIFPVEKSVNIPGFSYSAMVRDGVGLKYDV